MRRILIAAAAACALTGTGAPVWGASMDGAVQSSSPGTIPDRTIRITDRTRYVNVMRFETIRFVTGNGNGQDSSFDWRFDHNTLRVFALADIAPSGFLGNRSVQVYLQRDPPGD